MPPEDERRPSHADMKSITAWIERNLVAADEERQRTEGRVVLRRLNRVEYQNSVNDLLVSRVWRRSQWAGWLFDVHVREYRLIALAHIEQTIEASPEVCARTRVCHCLLANQCSLISN